MKAAIYTRVSSEEQTKGEKCSIETQLTDCESHCNGLGDTVVKRYSEIQSGVDALKDRVQFEQMLSDAKQGMFEKIVVWRPDRLFRGLKPAAKLAAVLDETRISIEGVQQPIDRNTIGLWAWVAEQEINTMKQRMGAGKRAKARQFGKWCGGFIKYGYCYIKDAKAKDYTGKLQIDESEAKVVRELFERVDSGKTVADWVRWANEQSIPTKRRSRGWTLQEACAMVREKCYTGKGFWGKTTRKGNKCVKADNPVTMEYPQIISEELFQRVGEKLKGNKRMNNGGAKQLYILQHLGRCGECGGPLCCCTNKGYRYIYCLNQRRYPHVYKCFSHPNMRLTDIENFVWAEVDDVIHNYSNSTYGLLLDRFENDREDREKQIVKAKEQLEAVNLEKQRMITLVVKGYVNGVESEAQFIVINKNREHWETELSNAEAVQNNSNIAWETFMSQLHELDKMFNYGFHLSNEQKKQFLNIFLKQFVLSKDGKIEFRFKLPVNEKQVSETVLTLSQNDVILSYWNMEVLS